MHYFVTEMSTKVHISVTKWCIVRYGTGALWYLEIGLMLTHLYLDEEGSDLADDMFNSLSLNEDRWIVTKCPLNIIALVFIPVYRYGPTS